LCIELRSSHILFYPDEIHDRIVPQKLKLGKMHVTHKFFLSDALNSNKPACDARETYCQIGLVRRN
jgi:hypothetical protein